MAQSKKAKPTAAKTAVARDERWLHFYRQMVKIRLFEEEVNQLYLGAKMPGLAHLYIGEEAVAVGMCEALRQDDYITSTHRGHGHCLAKGAAPDQMFAELLGKEAGYCRGKGGSMHIADQDTGNLGANAIVGGSAGIATGAAMSAQMRGSDQVAVCFFGDGALGQGLLYEAMNMASLWKLPVIYVCENNQYNEYTHYCETTAGGVTARAEAFGIHTESIDGQDVRAVHAAAQKSVEQARRGDGPAFLLCNTYRFHGHHVGDIDRAYYRSKREEEEWKTQRDPVKVFAQWLTKSKLADGHLLGRIETEVAAEMKQAVTSPWRLRTRIRTRWISMSTPRHPSSSLPRRLEKGKGEGSQSTLVSAATREITFAQAINEALAEEMRRDPTVFIIGEDVAEAGTPFKVLSGLVEGVRHRARDRLADLGSRLHRHRRRRGDDRHAPGRRHHVRRLSDA